MTDFEKHWNKECKKPSFYDLNAKNWCQLFYEYGKLDQLQEDQKEINKILNEVTNEQERS